MNYTLHQLRIFLKVSELQSITKAAEALFLTQPAVSIQLKKLQDQFDIPLIEIIGKQLFVTDFGSEIARASQKILEETDQIKNLALAYKGLVIGRLKIAVVSTGKYVMPYFLTDFLQKYAGVELIMDVTNKAQVVSNLANNEVDFALVSVLPQQLLIDRVELMQNKLYLIRKYNPDEARQRIQVSTLAKIPLIFREKGSATRQAMESFIADSDITVRKSMALTSNEAVKQAVLAGLGYSVMPLIGIKNELLNQSLEIIQVKGLPIITHWNLIWLKEKNLSPIAQAYLGFVQEHKEKIIQHHFEWYEEY